MLKTTASSVILFVYHHGKRGPDCLKKFSEFTRIHSCWAGDIIYELKYTVGSNKIVKIFYQKRVFCLERDSDYIFKQCGHQCSCEHCYQNKGSVDILKCLVCRTEYNYT